MNLNNTMNVWNERCANQEEIIRKCEQVRELCELRDRCVTSILSKEESYTITYNIFTYVFSFKSQMCNVKCEFRITKTRLFTCVLIEIQELYLDCLGSSI